MKANRLLVAAMFLLAVCLFSVMAPQPAQASWTPGGGDWIHHGPPNIFADPPFIGGFRNGMNGVTIAYSDEAPYMETRGSELTADYYHRATSELMVVISSSAIYPNQMVDADHNRGIGRKYAWDWLGGDGYPYAKITGSYSLSLRNLASPSWQAGKPCTITVATGQCDASTLDPAEGGVYSICNPDNLPFWAQPFGVARQKTYEGGNSWSFERTILSGPIVSLWVNAAARSHSTVKLQNSGGSGYSGNNVATQEKLLKGNYGSTQGASNRLRPVTKPAGKFVFASAEKQVTEIPTLVYPVNPANYPKSPPPCDWVGEEWQVKDPADPAYIEWFLDTVASGIAAMDCSFAYDLPVRIYTPDDIAEYKDVEVEEDEVDVHGRKTGKRVKVKVRCTRVDLSNFHPGKADWDLAEREVEKVLKEATKEALRQQ